MEYKQKLNIKIMVVKSEGLQRRKKIMGHTQKSLYSLNKEKKP